MSQMKLVLHGPLGARLKTSVLHFLIFITDQFWKKQLLTPPPYDSHASRVFRGGLRGMFLVNPIGDMRPRFILGYFEPHVTRVIRSYVTANSIAYDIGANIGYHSLMMAKLVGPDGQVFCFEPNTVDYELLKWNCTINNQKQIQLIKAAVTNFTGTTKFASFQYPGIHHILREDTPADAQITEVACVALDDFVFLQNYPVPSFIKFDVEGSEIGLLKGAENLFSRYPPVIEGEVWQKNREWVIRYMTGFGYAWHELYSRDNLANILFTPFSQ